MLLAVHRRLAAFDTIVRTYIAALMRASLVGYIPHGILSVLSTVNRRLVTSDIEERTSTAGVVCAKFGAADINHSLLSKLLAVHHRLLALDIIVRRYYAVDV